MSGAGGVIKDVDLATQAAGAATGFKALQDYGQSTAARAGRGAEAFARPDLEKESMFSSPGAFTYKLSQALPTLGLALGGGEALGGVKLLSGAGRLATAARYGAPLLPSSIGANVAAGTGGEDREISQGEGLKAIALGAPEALAQGFVPSSLGSLLKNGASGQIIRRALTEGGVMGAMGGVQGGAQQAVTDAAYHPEMSLSDRAQNVVDAAMSGGIQGAIFGGVTGALRPAHITLDAPTADLDAATKGLLPAEASTTPQPPAQVPAQDLGQVLYGKPKTAENSIEQFATDFRQPQPPEQLAALPPPEKAGVPVPPGPIESLPSDQLKIAHDAMVDQDKMDSAQAGQLVAFREELAKRTQPGLKPGEGTLFTPDEVAARQPQVDAVKKSLDLPQKVQDTPFFKNLNAVDEPDLINAIDTELKKYDRVSKADATPDRPAQAAKKIPEWLSTIAEDRGLLDNGKKPPEVEDGASPLSWKLEDLNVDKAQAEKVRDALVPVGGEDLRQANAKVVDVNADIDKFTKLDLLQQEAAARKTDALAPKDPMTGEVIPQPGRVEPQPRPVPEGLTPPMQARWDAADAIVKGNNSDEIKQKALDHQQAIESGDLKGLESVKQTSQLKKDAAAEQATYQGADRSWSGNDAVQERGAAALDAREPSGNGAGVGEGDAAGTAARARQEENTAGIDTSKAHWNQPISESPLSAETKAKLGENLTPAKEAPRALVKAKTSAAEDHAKLQTLHDAEPDGSPRKDFAAKALAAQDPAAARRALDTLALDEQISGRKADSLRTPISAADDWAGVHADNINGDVVYNDGEHALVRGFSNTGKPVYVAANRASGLRTVQDVRDTKVLIDPAAKSKLVAAADKATRADEAAYSKNPDGPFQGKAGQVVSTPSVDPRVTQTAGNWARQMGLDNVRILITHPGDTRGAPADSGLNGPYNSARTSGVNGDRESGHARQFGPGLKDFYIYIKPGMDDTRTIEVLAHEMGHVVQKVQLNNATAPVQAALKTAYDKWFKETSGLSGTDMMRTVKPRSLVDEQWSNTSPQTTMSYNSLAYMKSFPEWFADNVSRWATTSEKPVGAIQQFFAAVAQKMRQFMQVVTGNRYLPDAAVKDFMDRMGGASEAQAAMPWFGDAKIQASTAATSAARSPQEVDQRVKSGVASVNNIQKFLNEKWVNLTVATRRAMLGGERADFLVNNARSYLKSGVDYHTATEVRMQRADAKDKVDSRSMEGYNALNAAQRDQVDSLLGKMQNSWGLDPRKNLAYYAKQLTADPENAERASDFHKEMQGDLSRLQQATLPNGKNAGLKNAMESILRMNQTKGLQENVAHMHAMSDIYADKGISLFGDSYRNPDEVFRAASTLHDDPVKAQKFYGDIHDMMRNSIKSKVDAATAEAAPFLKDQPERAAKINASVSDLRSLLSSVDDRKAMIDTGTYSPMSRQNYDHFVSGKVTLGPDGRPSAKSMAEIEKRMVDGGFKDIGLSHFSDSPTIMAKVPDLAAMNRLNAIFEGAKADGHMSDLAAGHVDNPTSMQKVGSAFMQQMVAHLSNMADRAGLDQVQAESLKKQMIAHFMDTVGDHSILPNTQKRDFTSGFDTNMGQAAGMRALNSSRASSQVSSRGEVARADAAMAAENEANKRNGALLPAQREIGQDVIRELRRREAEAAWHIPHGFIDTASAAMHTMQVGLNIPYTLTATSQIPMLLHGELAKKYGMVGAAKAIGKASGPAFKALTAVLKSADRAGFGIREDTLKAAGLSDRHVNAIMNAANSGSFTSFSQSMTALGEGASSRATKIKNTLNLLGVASEQLPRLIAAISASDLHTANPGKAGMGHDDYVKNIIDGSQFKWGAGETSRWLGNKGIFGAPTRIMLGFMNFQTQMLQKLYQETHELATNEFGNRKEAGIFLMSHLAAVTALSGTLGLPFASAAAGAFDKLYASLTGRDDMDIMGSYRTYLAHTFGPDIADVIAKGLPRAANLDLSKLGDANLLPGTGFLTDKRKFEDASKDWLKSMAGAGGSEVGNMVLGGRDIMNGDFMLGAMKFAPEILKGAFEGAYYSQHGYVNKDGTPLPIGNPTTYDLVLASMGFDPAHLAQYNEAKRIAQGLQAQRQYREQNISQHLVKAQMTGNENDLSKWITEASDFQMQHPGMGSPLREMPQEFKKQLQAGMIARATNAPIGVGMMDPARLSSGFLSTSK